MFVRCVVGSNLNLPVSVNGTVQVEAMRGPTELSIGSFDSPEYSERLLGLMPVLWREMSPSRPTVWRGRKTFR